MSAAASAPGAESAHPRLHLAVAGKGGAGKSLVAATLARLLARRGHRVLALDSDTLPGLTFSLGAEVPAVSPLTAASEQDADGRWRLRRGIGPVRAVQRFSTPAPDGVRLLQGGKSGRDGLAPAMGAVHAFHAIIHRIPAAASLRAWVVVGDLSGGARQTAFGWAPYADRLLLVVEPTAQSILTARRIERIARARRDVETLLVVNKVTGPDDVADVERALRLPATGAVPADDGVRAAERLGVAVLDLAPASPAVIAIDRLAARIVRASVPAR